MKTIIKCAAGGALVCGLLALSIPCVSALEYHYDADLYDNHFYTTTSGNHALDLDSKVQCLENGLEDSLTFYAFPKLDSRKISSSNVIERLNREIRRRTSVVGIFPNEASYVRLVTTYLMEYAEDWSVSRAYLSQESIEATLLIAA